MFFVISKVLSYLLNPLFWIFTLLIIAYFIKNKKTGQKLLLISIIAFYLFSNRFICDEFIRIWEFDFPEKSFPKEQYDVGIVLSGDIVSYDYRTEKLIFRQQADRLIQAIDLYKQGKIKKILLTGGSGQLSFSNQPEASFMKKHAVKLGISENDILLDSISKNTFQNAAISKKMLEVAFPNGGRFLLITSALHIRRSLAVFKKASIIVDAYPTSKLTGIRLYNFEHLFVPHVSSFESWSDLIHEWVGYIIYKIMGYI
ncbi:MAG: YdcF family protein [Bacteroidetes bacterium]|nr:YdcF family protein [Bacteroidota bacterium]